MGVAIQRFRKSVWTQTAAPSGQTRLASGKGSSIVSNAVRFAGPKRKIAKVHESNRLLLQRLRPEWIGRGMPSKILCFA